MRIRPAEIRDAGAVADLMTQLGYPTLSEEMTVRLESILARPDYYAAVAVDGDRVVGMIGACWSLCFEKNGRYGRITAIVVDERHRGRGAGSALLRDAEGWLASQDARWCLINSASHRERAHAFFEQQGYKVTGKRFAKVSR